MANVNEYGRGHYNVEGVRALAEALKLHNTLTSLNLGSTQLCGYNALGQGLCVWEGVGSGGGVGGGRGGLQHYR